MERQRLYHAAALCSSLQTTSCVNSDQNFQASWRGFHDLRWLTNANNNVGDASVTVEPTWVYTPYEPLNKQDNVTWRLSSQIKSTRDIWASKTNIDNGIKAQMASWWPFQGLKMLQPWMVVNVWIGVRFCVVCCLSVPRMRSHFLIDWYTSYW